MALARSRTGPHIIFCSSRTSTISFSLRKTVGPLTETARLRGLICVRSSFAAGSLDFAGVWGCEEPPPPLSCGSSRVLPGLGLPPLAFALAIFPLLPAMDGDSLLWRGRSFLVAARTSIPGLAPSHIRRARLRHLWGGTWPSMLVSSFAEGAAVPEA